MSKSLIKLVDEAILPAFLIVGTKVIAIAFINNLIPLMFYYQNFGKISFLSSIDQISINSFSDMAVYIMLLIGMIIILMKLIYFTDNKEKSNLILKLAKSTKLTMVQASIDVYHILFVWMVFFTGMTIFILIRILNGTDYIEVGLISIAIYLCVFWVILKEVEKDIVKKLDFGKNTLA